MHRRFLLPSSSHPALKSPHIHTPAIRLPYKASNRPRHIHTNTHPFSGVTRLFEHQAKAINAALSGQHIAIATATASGKSVVYNTPVLQVRGTRRGGHDNVYITGLV